MHYVLAYDVVSTRRRGRFHRRLKAFLVPVQRSVFEGPLTPSALGEIERLITTHLDMEQDAVRLYALDRVSLGLTRSWGVQANVDDPDAPMLF